MFKMLQNVYSKCKEFRLAYFFYFIIFFFRKNFTAWAHSEWGLMVEMIRLDLSTSYILIWPMQVKFTDWLGSIRLLNFNPEWRGGRSVGDFVKYYGKFALIKCPLLLPIQVLTFLLARVYFAFVY